MQNLMTRVYIGPAGKHRLARSSGSTDAGFAIPGRSYQVTEACARNNPDRFAAPIPQGANALAMSAGGGESAVADAVAEASSKAPPRAGKGR